MDDEHPSERHICYHRLPIHGNEVAEDDATDGVDGRHRHPGDPRYPDGGSQRRLSRAALEPLVQEGYEEKKNDGNRRQNETVRQRRKRQAEYDYRWEDLGDLQESPCPE